MSRTIRTDLDDVDGPVLGGASDFHEGDFVLVLVGQARQVVEHVVVAMVIAPIEVGAARTKT